MRHRNAVLGRSEVQECCPGDKWGTGMLSWREVRHRNAAVLPEKEKEFFSEHNIPFLKQYTDWSIFKWDGRKFSKAYIFWPFGTFFTFQFLFLALLDYVSRAHEIEIRWVSVRLLNLLSLNLLHGRLLNFSCFFSWAIYTPKCFSSYFLKNKISSEFFLRFCPLR